MSAPRQPTDDFLDARLREVPVPADLLRSLKRMAGPVVPASEPVLPLYETEPQADADSAADAELDRCLVEVAVPLTLLARLREICVSPARATQPGQAAVSRPLDRQLRTVEVPFGLTRRLREIARGTEPIWAAAAMILVAALLAGVGLWQQRPGEPGADALRTSVVTTSATPADPSLDALASGAGAGEAAVEWLDPARHATVQTEAVNEAELHTAAERVESWLVDAAVPDAGAAPLASSLEPRAADARSLLLDAQSARLRVYATDRTFDDQPELFKMPVLRPRGLDPPTEPGFDLLFLRRYGVHPFVPAAAIRGLQVPLDARPESFELARRCLAENEWPPSEAVRTEEFLAALDYDWPAPTGRQLGLRVAAGPSPLAAARNEAGLALVQFGVQVGDPPASKRQPFDLIVVVDLSASMRWGGRLAMVRDALHAEFARLAKDYAAPQDRWTIVAFSEQPSIVVDGLPGNDRVALDAAVERLVPQSGTNIGAGLELAHLVADELPADARRRRRIVLLSDGLARLDEPSMARLAERFSAPGKANVGLTVISLAPEQRADAPWNALAVETGSEFMHCASAAEIGATLREAATGQSTLAARDARLQVEFDPELVESYRLLGHESHPVAGMVSSQGESDLRLGQTCVALFEVKLRDEPAPKTGPRVVRPDGVVATATVEWREPRSGVAMRLRQTVLRRQFAQSFGEASPALQQAALAAGAAEVLRGSYFARGVRMAELVKLAGQLPEAVSIQPDVTLLATLLGEAAQLEDRRGAR
ncbi:MAG: von Willebrand factor type A domain-containing protein [Pirellulales bacterium]|nr:von Willebrand factor type A domain-containing protein [Pirellulales bacterium]